MHDTDADNPTGALAALLGGVALAVGLLTATVAQGVGTGALHAVPAWSAVVAVGVSGGLAALAGASTLASTLRGPLAITALFALFVAGVLLGSDSPVVAFGMPAIAGLAWTRVGPAWGRAALGFGALLLLTSWGLAGAGLLPAPARVDPTVEPLPLGLLAGSFVFGLGFFGFSRMPSVELPVTPAPPPARRAGPARSGAFTREEIERFEARTDRYSAHELAAARASLSGEVSLPPDQPEIEATLEMQKLESVGVLAGGIAHDFNNLLMSILGNSSIALMEAEEDDPTYPHLREIEIAARRARDLVSQLLAYAGKGNLQAAPIDVNELVREMGDLLATAAGRRATLKYEMSDTLPLMVGDPTQIRQIVMNLITNAADATSQGGGEVLVQTELLHMDRTALDETLLGVTAAAGPYVKLEVRDEGVGMDQDTLSHIFDPFYTTKKTGRGLGLAAVLGIVRRHEGTMEVVSQLGRGTTFRVYFPYADTVDEDEDIPTALTSTAKGWRAHLTGSILVVDDDPVVLKVTRRMVERLEFEVLEAHDGEAALEVYEAQRDSIVAVLLDMTMPGLDGAETLEKLRELDAEARVILCSGYSEADIPRLEAVFLQKPYSLKQLTKALDQVMPA